MSQTAWIKEVWCLRPFTCYIRSDALYIPAFEDIARNGACELFSWVIFFALATNSTVRKCRLSAPWTKFSSVLTPSLGLGLYDTSRP